MDYLIPSVFCNDNILFDLLSFKKMHTVWIKKIMFLQKKKISTLYLFPLERWTDGSFILLFVPMPSGWNGFD